MGWFLEKADREKILSVPSCGIPQNRNIHRISPGIGVNNIWLYTQTSWCSEHPPPGVSREKHAQNRGIARDLR